MKRDEFSTLLTRYLAHYLPVQRSLSSNTIRSYRDTFKLLLTFCRDVKGMNISKLTIKQLDKKCLEDFLLWISTERNAAPATYNQRLYALHAFFDYVMTEEPEYMEHCQRILKISGMETPEKPAHYLTAADLERILSSPDASVKRGRRHLTLLTVLYDTGARVSELADIRIRDVRLEFPAIITLHGKGGKERTVPIMKQTVALLRDYFAENRIDPKLHFDLPLFWNSHRKKLTRSGITYIVKKYTEEMMLEDAGGFLKISPHTFRHTKAMHLVQADVNPVYIKDYLGHANLSTTEIYARADNEAKRAVLEKASERFHLPKVSDWEHDAELIEWLSSLS